MEVLVNDERVALLTGEDPRPPDIPVARSLLADRNTLSLRLRDREGRCVALITNAPRTAEAVEQQLARIGLPREAYDFVATSGEAGIEALNALGRPVGFVGTAGDREILEGRGVRIAWEDAFTAAAYA